MFALDTDGVGVGVTEGVASGVGDGVIDGEIDGVTVGVLVGVTEGDASGEGEGVTVGVVEGVVETLGVTDGVAEGDVGGLFAGSAFPGPPPLSFNKSCNTLSEILLEESRCPFIFPNLDAISSNLGPCLLGSVWILGIGLSIGVVVLLTLLELS